MSVFTALLLMPVLVNAANAKDALDNTSMPVAKCGLGECLSDGTSLMQTVLHKSQRSQQGKSFELNILVITFNHNEASSKLESAHLETAHKALNEAIVQKVKPPSTATPQHGARPRITHNVHDTEQRERAVQEHEAATRDKRNERFAQPYEANNFPEVIMMANQELRAEGPYSPLKQFCKDSGETAGQEYQYFEGAQLKGKTKVGESSVVTGIEVAVRHDLTVKGVKNEQKHLYFVKRTKGIVTMELEVDGFALRLGGVHLDTGAYLKDLTEIGKQVETNEKQMPRLNIIAGDYNSRVKAKADLDKKDCDSHKSREAIKQEFNATVDNAQALYYQASGLTAGLETLTKNSGLAGLLPDAPKADGFFLPTYCFPKGCDGCTPSDVVGNNFQGLDGEDPKLLCRVKRGDIGLGQLDYFTVLYNSDHFHPEIAAPLTWEGQPNADHALTTGRVVVRKKRQSL